MMLVKCSCGTIIDRVPGTVYQCPTCGIISGGLRMSKEWYKEQHEKCEKELKENAQ
jgi:hypothetical protein